MTALGDVGQNGGENDSWNLGYTAAVPFASLWRVDDVTLDRPFTHRTHNNACVATITGATVGALVTLLRGGTFAGSAFADGSGNAVFYEIDNTNSPTPSFYAYESGSVKAWEISVAAGVATVTPLSGGGGGTVAFGYVQ